MLAVPGGDDAGEGRPGAAVAVGLARRVEHGHQRLALAPGREPRALKMRIVRSGAARPMSDPARAQATINVDLIRDQFPSLAETDDGHPRIYLDNPAGTQVPQVVGRP